MTMKRTLFILLLLPLFRKPPDTSQLLIISNSIRFGIKRGIRTIFGDLTANCIQTIGAAFGFAAIIATSANASQSTK